MGIKKPSLSIILVKHWERTWLPGGQISRAGSTENNFNRLLLQTLQMCLFCHQARVPSRPVFFFKFCYILREYFLSSLQTDRASEYSFERWVGGQVLQLQFRKLGEIKPEIQVTSLRPGKQQACQVRFNYKRFRIQQSSGAHTHPFLLRASIFSNELTFHLALFSCNCLAASLFFPSASDRISNCTP